MAVVSNHEYGDTWKMFLTSFLFLLSHHDCEIERDQNKVLPYLKPSWQVSIYFLINFSVFSFEINCQTFMCCQNCIECMGGSSVSMVCPCSIHSYCKTLSVKFTCFHSQQSTQTCVTNSDIDHFMVFLSDSLLFSLR